MVSLLPLVYTGWPRKNRTAYFPQHVDAIIGISVWGNFSWQKWYQDHQCWFSRLFLGHICETMSRPQIFPVQLKLHEWMPFWLATVMSSKSIYFCQRALLRVGFWCKECALIKLIGWLLTTMTSRNGIHSHILFKLKREDFGSRHCLTKCTLENKLLNQNWWSWYFSQEKLPHTLIPVIASTYCGSMPFHFFWATLYISLSWFIALACLPRIPVFGEPDSL